MNEPLNAKHAAALRTLMDDPSPSVRAAVEREIIRYGSQAVDMLVEVVETETSGSDQSELALALLERLDVHQPERDLIRFIRSQEYELESGLVFIERVLNPDFDAVKFQMQLNDLAARCRELMAIPSSSHAISSVISRVLNHEYGFRLDGIQSEALESISIHSVLESKRGDSFALALCYLLVAERIGFELLVIDNPLRGVLGYFQGVEPFYLDAGAGWAVRSLEELHQMINASGMTPDLEHFAPIPVSAYLSDYCSRIGLALFKEGRLEESALFHDFEREFLETHRKSTSM